MPSRRPYALTSKRLVSGGSRMRSVTSEIVRSPTNSWASFGAACADARSPRALRQAGVR